MTKTAFFGTKWTIFEPQKMTEMAKKNLSNFFLQFLAKFKQKRTQKYKNMAGKGIYGQKKAIWVPPKWQKSFFSQTYFFTLFSQIK